MWQIKSWYRIVKSIVLHHLISSSPTITISTCFPDFNIKHISTNAKYIMGVPPFSPFHKITLNIRGCASSTLALQMKLWQAPVALHLLCTLLQMQEDFFMWILYNRSVLPYIIHTYTIHFTYFYLLCLHYNFHQQITRH